MLGIPYEVQAAPIDESPRNGEAPDGMACRLCQRKAHAAASLLGELPAWILAADTVVVHEGRLLGKPSTAAEAVEFLARLRGGCHRVVSGVTLLHARTFTQRTETLATTVRMRDYSDEEIRAYVASGDALDKAGAYAIQDADFHPVAAIEGCFANVMGLPLCIVRRLLNEAAGYTLPAVTDSCELTFHIPCTLATASSTAPGAVLPTPPDEVR